MRVHVCVHACGEEAESPTMWKRTRNSSGCVEALAVSSHQVQHRLDARAGEWRIDVMWINYPEPSQVLHLTDALTQGFIKEAGHVKVNSIHSDSFLKMAVSYL